MRYSIKRSILVIMVLCTLLVCVPFSGALAEDYLWPVPSSRTITQQYSSSHPALDIGGSGSDVTIVATKSGTVAMVYTGCNSFSSIGTCTTSTCSPNIGIYSDGTCNWGYGNGVAIRHSDGTYSCYAHMQPNITVSVGQVVAQGDVIGYMGSSGRSTGRHLHFEVIDGHSSAQGKYYGHSSDKGINGLKISSFVYEPGASVPGVAACGCSEAYAGWYTQAGASGGLAISSGHGASTAAGNTELGLIPKNAVIHISMATGYSGRGNSSGHYGHVVYNGISGYCAMNLLDLVPSYTMTLNANGGSVEQTSFKVWANISDYNDLSWNIPTRSGYTFLGWYTAASGGTQVYNASGRCTNEGAYWSNNAYVYGANSTLYAHWESSTVYASSINLSMSSASMTVGGSLQLQAEVLPSNTSNKSVYWSTSDHTVATVSDGLVQAVGVGSATITVAAADGSGVTASCVVTVSPIYVQSITLNHSSVTVNCNSTVTLRATVLPANATNQSVSWVSSDSSIASVQGGVVTGVSAGTTTVKAAAADGSGVYAVCTVTVTPVVDSFELAVHTVTMADSGIGSRYRIGYTISPAEMGDGIVWSSTDPDVAIVSADGTVTAVAEGRAVIEASIPYGPSDQCIVKVQSGMALMTLPSSLTTVEAEALQNTGAVRVKLPDTCTAIGSGAFASNSSLRYILIPNSVTSIAEDAFSSSTQVCIICGNGSVAHQFARDKGIAYVIDDDASFVAVRSITMDAARSIVLDESVQLTAVVLPAGASNAALRWSSSDESVATVSAEGVVTGLNPGSTVITAAAVDGSGISAACTVTVEIPDVKVSAAVDSSAQQIGGNNAVLAASLTVTGTELSKVQQTGILLYDASKTRLASKLNAPVLSEDALLCSHDVGASLSYSLQPLTTYYYRYAVVVSGITFYSDYLSFTTTAMPPQITLSASSITMSVGQSTVLTALVQYTDETDVIWRTSSSAIVTVMDGEIVANGTGVATITVLLAADTSVKAVCTVTVSEETADMEVTHALALNSTAAALDAGGSMQLTAIFTPSASIPVVWSSSNSAVAQVDSTGTVLAIAPGRAIITATAESLGISASCTVDVTAVSSTGVTLSASALTLTTGDTATLTATVLPQNAANRAVIWSTDNASVATVNNGVVTAVGAGTVTITAAAADGSGAAASCQVTVNAPPAAPSCGCSTSYAGKYVVYRTGGDTLAISSGHGPSYNYSELGSIPQGTQVYVSAASGPAGTSGMWGHVTYNGVSGYCAMYYLSPVMDDIDTSNENANMEKINRVIAQANAWADHTWVANVDIPVYNNTYASNRTQYWYPAGTVMRGIPYTLAGSGAKYTISSYMALSDADKGAATTFTYDEAYMWGPKYGGDCSCLVNDVLWYGDPAIGHDGQTQVASDKAHMYNIVSWDQLAPGDVLAKKGHVIIVIGVSGSNVTIVESRGNGSNAGALQCPNKTARAAGGYYVCGTCSYCNGANKCGAIRRTVALTKLQEEYTVYRYKMLYQ